MHDLHKLPPPPPQGCVNIFQLNDSPKNKLIYERNKLMLYVTVGPKIGFNHCCDDGKMNIIPYKGNLPILWYLCI